MISVNVLSRTEPKFVLLFVVQFYILMFSCYFCSSSVYIILLFGRYLTCHQNGLWALRVGKLLINNSAKIHQNHDRANCVGQQYIDILHTQLDISQKESAIVKFDFSPLKSITNMRDSNIISNSRCPAMFRLQI